jgi:hypothetical protein
MAPKRRTLRGQGAIETSKLAVILIACYSIKLNAISIIHLFFPSPYLNFILLLLTYNYSLYICLLKQGVSYHDSKYDEEVVCKTMMQLLKHPATPKTVEGGPSGRHAYHFVIANLIVYFRCLIDFSVECPIVVTTIFVKSVCKDQITMLCIKLPCLT